MEHADKLRFECIKGGIMKNNKIYVFVIAIIFFICIWPLRQVNAYSAYLLKDFKNQEDIGIGVTVEFRLEKKKNAVYTFYSSDKNVAVVNKDTGVLRGMKAGKAIITCKEKMNGKTTVFATCIIKVNDIVINEKVDTIAIGEERSVFYFMGYRNPEAKYQYSSLKSSIATVDKYGTIKAKNLGTTKIAIKEVLKGKTRTVGHVNIQVEAASIAEMNINSHLFGVSKEGFLVITTDTLLNPRYFLDYWNSEAVYNFKTGDESILKIDKRGDSIYLSPITAGVTSLSVEETYKGKTGLVGKAYVAIDLRRNLEINKSMFRSSDSSYVTVTEGTDGNFLSLFRLKDIKNYDVDMKDGEVRFTTDNKNIIDLDEKTGIFQAKGQGVALIKAFVTGSEASIKVKVVPKGTMGKVEEQASVAMKKINDLANKTIVSENIADLWNDVMNLNHSIGYYPEMDWGESENSIFGVIDDSNYWAVPNYYQISKISKNVVDMLHQEALELQKKQEIVKVLEIKKDSFIVKFKYPITKNFVTYYQAISKEGDMHEEMLICDLANADSDLKNTFGTMDIDYNSNKVKVNLSYDLVKGTYLLKFSDSIGVQPFEFTFK